MVGVWTRDSGLTRLRVDPTANVDQIDAAADEVAWMLADLACRAPPFMCADHIELWLLDRAGLPLALLLSVRDAGACRRVNEVQWILAPLANLEVVRSAAGDAQALGGCRVPVGQDLAGISSRLSRHRRP